MSQRATYVRKAHLVPRMAAESALGAAEEPSDFAKFIDRWNTKGGAILATFVGLGLGYAMKQVLVVAGVEDIYAGVWVSGFYFFGMCIWLSQYLFRVMTKSTTYAQQLEMYEQQVMMERLNELDEEEIAALCEETGVSDANIQEALGDKVKALSQKEKVIELFKNAQGQMPQDPRSGLS